MKEDDNFTPVEVFAGTEWQAGFVQSMLEDNEIQAFLKDEIMGNIAPWYGASGGVGSVKVVVAKEDEEKAMQIVADYYKNMKE